MRATTGSGVRQGLTFPSPRELRIRFDTSPRRRGEVGAMQDSGSLAAPAVEGLPECGRIPHVGPTNPGWKPSPCRIPPHSGKGRERWLTWPFISYDPKRTASPPGREIGETSGGITCLIDRM